MLNNISKKTSNRMSFKSIVLICYISLFLFLTATKIGLFEICIFAHSPEKCYIFSIVGIFTTLVLLPISVAFKKLNDKTRLVIQLCTAIVNIGVYLFTLETSGLLCALIALCFSIVQKTNSFDDYANEKQE